MIQENGGGINCFKKDKFNSLNEVVGFIKITPNNTKNIDKNP
jgi:hypothetical protein